MVDRAHSLARDELVRVLTVFSGVTTSDGAEDKDTLIDSSLVGENDFITGKTILLMSGEAKYEDKGAVSFDRNTGTITLESGVSAQIVAGTLFRILNISSVETLIKDLTKGLVSFSGKTTADGGDEGSSLICSDLEDEADFDGNQVVITTGDYRGQARDITADTTEGTVTPHLNFGGVIVEGTEFIITAIRVVPAEVAALAADLGDMADAATNDNMSDITTTSAMAKLRLILNRMSPDAFAPRIYGDDRTTLELALNNLAKYWAGNANQFGVKINNGLLRTNLNDLLDDWANVFGIQGISTFGPRVYGVEASTIEEAFLYLARYWTPNGNIIGTRINNFPERSNLIALLEDWANVFGMQGAGTWAPRVYGVDTSTVEEAFLYLARYWTGNGNQFNSKINNGVARTNLNDLLDDWALLFGVAGSQEFLPNINGAARTTIEAAFAAIGTIFAGITGATGQFYEQADAAVNISAISGSETNVFNLVVASTRYIVRSLRLKCANPGSDTVTVRLYELVNNGLTEVDSFAIDTNNFGTYHSLMDMFGMAQLAGDNLKVTVQSDAGTYAVTGQYSHAKTNV